MPGAVPQTATAALTNATLPYVKQLASKGWKAACESNPSLSGGLSLVNGQVLNKEIARLFDKKHTPLQEILNF
jgi:alanine dehydrogenase